MKLLAFDTSASACSVALLNKDHVISHHQTAPMQQASLILPMIKQVLEEASLTFDQLDAIAYGYGPGSFTGIRLASSVAQGIGFVFSLPIFQISSLAAIAQAAFDEHGKHRILVALDARMQEIYWGEFEINDRGYAENLGQELLCNPKSVSIKDDFSLSTCMGVGDAWAIYQEELVEAIGFKPPIIHASQQPTANAILQLAKLKIELGEKGVSAIHAAPVYLR